MRLLIMGPPGAGKGTQAAHIAERYGIPAISTGDIFRANVSRGTELGLEAKRYMDAGEYVPDDVTNRMLRNRIEEEDTADGFLLDGYPRTVAQVDELDGMIGVSGHRLDAVVVLTADGEEIVQRLLQRARVEGRADDTEEVIRRRLEVYAEQTAPLIGVYGDRDLLVEVDGMGEVDDVTARVLRALEAVPPELSPTSMALWDRGLEIKDPDQIAAMRKAGIVVGRTLALLRSAVRAGISTAELDAIAEDSIRTAGATPSFLGYQGFPASICVSVNDEVVHGIPGDRVLASGDVVSLDCGAIVDGWHGDAAITVPVGVVPDEVAALVGAAEGALWQGIAAARLGGRISDISRAVEAHVRAAGTYGILEDYVGHGIGSQMHQPPNVPNVVGARKGPRLVRGLALAVEPMITLGDADTEVLDDDWTVVTTDGSWAAHVEHTFTLTPDGPWVLTALDGGEAELTALGVPFGGR